MAVIQVPVQKLAKRLWLMWRRLARMREPASFMMPWLITFMP